jgi:hypothetical protein
LVLTIALTGIRIKGVGQVPGLPDSDCNPSVATRTLYSLTSDANRGAAFPGGYAGIRAGISAEDARKNAVMAWGGPYK